jgi:predicted nucleic-acid-binding Zn-ribbon protein
MMTKCPDCGSSEIVPDLIVYTDEATSGQIPAYVKLVEPEPAKRPFIWMPQAVKTGFRAAICGACGHTQFYTKYHTEILDTYKKGYVGQPYSLGIVPIP